MKKETKKIGDFTIKEYALLCEKHLKNGCKGCPLWSKKYDRC